MENSLQIEAILDSTFQSTNDLSMQTYKNAVTTHTKKVKANKSYRLHIVGIDGRRWRSLDGTIKVQTGQSLSPLIGFAEFSGFVGSSRFGLKAVDPVGGFFSVVIREKPRQQIFHNAMLGAVTRSIVKCYSAAPQGFSFYLPAFLLLG